MIFLIDILYSFGLIYTVGKAQSLTSDKLKISDKATSNQPPLVARDILTRLI
jgi:hypothetical protein